MVSQLSFYFFIFNPALVFPSYTSALFLPTVAEL